MSTRLALAAAAAIAFASPAFAQDTTQTPPPAEQQRPLTAEEQAFQTNAQAFDAQMNDAITQIRAILADSATSGAQKTAAVDGVLANVTPGVNAFADQMQVFLTSQQAVVTDPAQRAQLDQALTEGPAAVRDIPNRIRTSVAQAIAQGEAQAAAGGAAAAPAPASGAVAGTIQQQ